MRGGLTRLSTKLDSLRRAKAEKELLGGNERTQHAGFNRLFNISRPISPQNSAKPLVSQGFGESLSTLSS